MRAMIRRFVLAVVLLGLGFGGARARADLIDVQFNTSGTETYTGAAVLGAAGDRWNAFGQDTLSGASGSGALVRSDGTASGVTLSYSTQDGFYDASGSGAIFNGTPYANLMNAYLVADLFGDGPGTVSLAGLTPGDTYRLILYSAADTTGLGRVTDFTVTGQTTQMQSVTSNTPANFNTPDVNYADFTTTPDSHGGLSITITAGNGYEGDLNGIQLQDLGSIAVVPEPNTLLVASVGAMFGLAVAWRRRARASRTPA